MIVFCDTSALMKLYASELHSDWTRGQVTAASHCVVSQITWVEMCAAFALKERTSRVTPRQTQAALKRFHAEWHGYVRAALDAALLTKAGELALQLGLRAYDSVQLASAYQVHLQLGRNMVFLGFDKQLNSAAGKLGIPLQEP